ncbi:Acyl-CoA dehydrogenase/oxidase, N-terminal and middle domain [Pseudocohnilembus persalinus]|uniref:Acyl-CoA dehydrogenase/oxidase, N-terminal and middle domain n=1 Tax=Pseudocohnilembus persalinus TaxID=266149 RepID=A0A0V0R5X2_PSEPJ|nr:Acyl-CoA dehydrogenase/oxidase, N-terminal and middle domain [Pseudocohnilembus persalinus]|eukprot:KRX09754.1 Acyl-CoA dehydrogenase/oxidase, N-terminal and middle domain [Pseudocohnilembus persalinus]
MTEPMVASSDATNIATTILKQGSNYIVNGRKWYISMAGHPDCKISIVMGITPNKKLPSHQQHSMILVPMNTPGVLVKRPMEVLGYDDAPFGHMEIIYDNVVVPEQNILLGEGRGFEIAQGRLGPGRIHHCMRLIGATERAYENLMDRLIRRKVFKKDLLQYDSIRKQVAKSRLQIDQTRLLVLHAARMIDEVGPKYAKNEIAQIKVAAPNMALEVIDRVIQIYGAAGLSQDTVLADMYASSRTLRIADGPDDVHLDTIAKNEINKYYPKL